MVLFDEVEKAHADVMNVLLGVLDDGRWVAVGQEGKAALLCKVYLPKSPARVTREAQLTLGPCHRPARVGCPLDQPKVNGILLNQPKVKGNMWVSKLTQ